MIRLTHLLGVLKEYPMSEQVIKHIFSMIKLWEKG